MEAVREIAAPGRKAPDSARHLRELVKAGIRHPRFPSSASRNGGKFAGGSKAFLQMAALRACAERDTARLTQWGQADLLEDAVSRERDYVKRRRGLNATRALLAERGAA